jgi:hypothetical protein
MLLIACYPSTWQTSCTRYEKTGFYVASEPCPDPRQLVSDVALVSLRYVSTWQTSCPATQLRSLPLALCCPVPLFVSFVLFVVNFPLC